MQNFFQILLDEVDKTLIANLDPCQKIIESYESQNKYLHDKSFKAFKAQKIQKDVKGIQILETKYDPRNRLFDGESFKAFQAYKKLQDVKGLKILETQRGSNIHDECNRLLLLNQFKAVYIFMLFTKRSDQQGLNQKAIAYFWLFGYDQYLHQQIQSFQNPPIEITCLSYLQLLDEIEPIDYRMHPILLADRYCKLRLQEIAGFKGNYVRKFRMQTYYFDQISQDTNNMLIEMNYAQMCRILVLPTDYFNEYYSAFEYTIMKLFIHPNVNPYFEQFLKNLNFKRPKFEIADKELFMNAVHTGITRAIVNQKIQLNPAYKGQEWKTAILDGCLILRRLQKWSQLDPIDDLVYETLIYKLK